MPEPIFRNISVTSVRISTGLSKSIHIFTQRLAVHKSSGNPSTVVFNAKEVRVKRMREIIFNAVHTLDLNLFQLGA